MRNMFVHALESLHLVPPKISQRSHTTIMNVDFEREEKAFLSLSIYMQMSKGLV